MRGLLLIVLSMLFGAVGGYLSGVYILQEKENAQIVKNVKTIYINESVIEDAVIRAYEEVSPSVVHITTTVLTRGFFYEIVPREGVGSGFVISEEGYIVTNYHVVENADFIRIKFPDGKEAYASIVGYDEDNDIAVLKVYGKDLKLKPAKLGNSDNLKIGEFVIAVGNPFGLDRTASLGIVSALNRSIETEDGEILENLIQTDASINPGNSGGPLINLNGEVIGINTAILTTSGGSIGIGFAIPINKAKKIIERILSEKPKETKPWMGVQGIILTKDLIEILNLPIDHGFLIFYVAPGSPAEKAGLRGGTQNVIIGDKIITLGGDIILSVDGIEIRSIDDLRRAIYRHEVGDKITVKIYRRGEIKEVTVELAPSLE